MDEPNSKYKTEYVLHDGLAIKHCVITADLAIKVHRNRFKVSKSGSVFAVCRLCKTRFVVEDHGHA